MKADIVKYAAENGNKRALKHFEKDFPELNESTIQNFRNKYYTQFAAACPKR